MVAAKRLGKVETIESVVHRHTIYVKWIRSRFINSTIVIMHTWLARPCGVAPRAHQLPAFVSRAKDQGVAAGVDRDAGHRRVQLHEGGRRKRRKRERRVKRMMMKRVIQFPSIPHREQSGATSAPMNLPGGQNSSQWLP